MTMSEKELKKLLEKEESDALERKSSHSDIKKIVQEVSSFANLKGGTLIIGVNDKGKPTGIQAGNKTIRDITQSIVDNTDPKIYPEITKETINGKNIIVIQINESPNKPHLAYNQAFMRVGDNTKQMSRDKYKEMLLANKSLEFDSMPCKEATLKDIDWNAVKKFIKKYEEIKKRKIKSTPKNLLKSLDCIKDNKPTNAGILLFGKNPQKLFTNAFITVVRYKGKTVGHEHRDLKEFTGNLFEQIDQTEEYIKDHTATMSRLIPGQIQRQLLPEYPGFVIRELIVNAVAHKDYLNQGTKTTIKMFEDRIEYYNAGGLGGKVTPKNIETEQFSRNKTIVKALNKIEYIEALGEGWDRILKEIKEHPLKPKKPQINDSGFSVLITTYAAKLPEEKEKTVTLNERQKKAIEFVKKEGRITNKDYRKLSPNITDRTALNDLTDLVKKNILERTGKTKSACYAIPK